MANYHQEAGNLWKNIDRVSELYSALQEECRMRKTKCDEYKRKCEEQDEEMHLFQQALKKLRDKQDIMQQQYKQEIERLQQQIQAQPSAMMMEARHSHTPHPAPSSYQSPYANGGSPRPTRTTPPPPQLSSGRQGHPGMPPGPPPQQYTNPARRQPEHEPIPDRDWELSETRMDSGRSPVDLVRSFTHSSVVCCVKFSPDGRFLAAGCNHITYIYEIKTGNCVAKLEDTSKDKKGDLYIRSISFSSDGKYIATGAEDKMIRIWDIYTKKIKQRLTGHEMDIYSLEFSLDGKILVSGSGDCTVRIWPCTFDTDMAEATKPRILYANNDKKDPDNQGKDMGVTSVAVSPDGRLVASGSLDKCIRIWDAHSGELLDSLKEHKDSVYSVAFMPDSKTLISGSLDKMLLKWRLEAGKQQGDAVLVGEHNDFVLSVATTPPLSNGQSWIVSGSKDRGVKFWDPRDPEKALFTLDGHKNSVISVATSPNPHEALFATGSGDNRARVWSYKIY